MPTFTVHEHLCFAVPLLYYQLNCCWPFPVGFSLLPGATLQENLRLLNFCIPVLTQLYQWAGGTLRAPSVSAFSYLWLLLLALSSSCKLVGSLKGDLVKFERKLENS